MKCSKCLSENPRDTLFCGKCGTKLGSPDTSGLAQTETLQTPLRELNTGVIFAGRYQVIEELGRGGMGKVYKVLDTELNERIALKLLKPEVSTDQETIERFRNELKTARRISHKNICRMYHLTKDEGTYYITMEYVPGEDLRRLNRKVGQMPVGKAVSIAKQVCEGLAEAHHQGIVHRDLKPQNIMVDEEGNARIMDFGIARTVRTHGLTDVGVMIGTPEYMSPEQAEAKGADHRSDIYSLGVVLYEMLTGRVPFEGDTPLSVAMKHKGEAPKNPKSLNAQIPEDLNRLILRCLEKEKEKRYQSAEDVLSDLDMIEKGLPTTERVIPKRRTLTAKEVTVTFKLKKLLLPAAILAFAAVAIVVWQILPGKEPVKRSIAVVNFTNQTGDKSYDYLQAAIPSLLITSLEESKHLSVMTWERMHDLLKQAGKENIEIIDSDLGFELCRKDNVEAIVIGSFIKAGEVFATDIKVLDVTTKRLLKSASSKGDGVGSILNKQIGDLSKEVSKGIGVFDRALETQGKIADLSTSSMEAYKYYLDGRTKLEKFYFAESVDSFKKAIEIDPNFAVAYLYMARVLNWLADTKERDEAFEKAKALSGKATEKERLYIEADYAGAIEKNPEKRVRILREIEEKFPKEKWAHFELATYFGAQRKFDDAVREYELALALDPSFGYAINQMAYLYSGKGDFEKALEYFQRYASLQPGDANPIDSMAETYFRMGDLDKSISLYQDALRLKQDFLPSYLGLTYVFALKERYEDALKTADTVIAIAPSMGAKAQGTYFKDFLLFWLGQRRRVVGELEFLAGIALSAGLKEPYAGLSLLIGLMQLELGNYEQSRKYIQSYYDTILAISPAHNEGSQAMFNFCLGLVDVKERKLDAAKAKIDALKSLLPKITPTNKEYIASILGLLEGEIFLAADSADKTIETLKSAPSLGTPPVMQTILLGNIPFLRDALARAYQKNGDTDKAIKEYERLMTVDPRQGLWTWIHPLYHFRLAKLYEKKGLKDQAVSQYQKFLDIWKNADPDIAEVAEAKKRLEILH